MFQLLIILLFGIIHLRNIHVIQIFILNHKKFYRDVSFWNKVYVSVKLVSDVLISSNVMLLVKPTLDLFFY